MVLNLREPNSSLKEANWSLNEANSSPREANWSLTEDIAPNKGQYLANRG